jgi:hypothetical protein
VVHLRGDSPVDRANQRGDICSLSAHTSVDDNRKRAKWQKPFEASQWKGEAAKAKYGFSPAQAAGRSYARGKCGLMQLRR